MKHLERELPTRTKAQLKRHLQYQRIYAVKDRAKEAIELLAGIVILQLVVIIILVILLNGESK